MPSAVVPTPAVSRSSLRVSWSRVISSRAGVPWVSGGRSVSNECWAVTTSASHSRAPWSRGSRCCSPVSGSVVGFGTGQRQQRGEEECSVLDGPVAPDPDSAGPVLADGQVAVQVRGTLLTLQLRFESAVDGVGVDHLGQMTPGPGQLGGIQAPGLTQQHLLPAPADQVTGRQVADGPDDDVGLVR